MVVVAAILDREHRLHHAGGNRRERDRPALLALAGDERGQQRRVEHQPLRRLVAELEPLDAVGAWRLRRRTARRRRAGGLRRRPERDADGLAASARVRGRESTIDAVADGELAGLSATGRWA